VLALLAAATAVAACGGGSKDSAASEPLVVSAAASLSDALHACRPDGARVSFAGSDELAAQIRQGVKPGVFAAANTTLPDQLHAAGLARAPRRFATNELVIAVAPGSDIQSLDDLANGAPKIAIGSRSVPVGAYARDVFARLDPEKRAAIEHNIRSEEPDVNGVVGKISRQAVAAGFVYATDARAAGLRMVELPSRLRPRVAYAAAVVKPSRKASAFLDDLVAGRCQDALRKAGFGAP
jgi:molybdate transport system substrate-binding protein